MGINSVLNILNNRVDYVVYHWIATIKLAATHRENYGESNRKESHSFPRMHVNSHIIKKRNI